MNPGPAPEHGATFDVMSGVAHELRQPLSSIESIAYYLGLVLPQSDARAQEHLARIQELVEQSHWILSSGLRLAGPARTSEGVAIDLEEIIIETAPRKNFKLELGGLPPVSIDPGQAKELVHSLVMLFRQIATAAHPVTIRTRIGEGAVLEFESTAPGYRSASALCPGAGLGIEVSRRIVERQGGAFEIAVTPESVHARVRLA